mmetsp:Transcript_11179/g.34467  ORF Transcript_11179/g.34467 Transcript_11179/m.34467 type:complete len:80 (+) Transcript_11179:209-448(+)
MQQPVRTSQQHAASAAYEQSYTHNHKQRQPHHHPSASHTLSILHLPFARIIHQILIHCSNADALLFQQAPWQHTDSCWI